MQVPRNAHIPHVESREEAFDLLSGRTATNTEDLEKRKLPGGLQKTYLLETVSGHNGPGIADILCKSGLGVDSVGGDDDTYRVLDEDRNGLGLLERVTDRYYAFYTLLPSNMSDKLVRGSVATNPWLDHLWISSQYFKSLWNYVRSVNSGRRYGKITFEHESIFEVIQPDGDLERNYEDERRTSRFTMVDRLDEIEHQMEPLQETYAPLASITHLRIPASGSGGHDLYYDGKATNRSNSFFDHRSALLGVVEMYASLTSRVEDTLWLSHAPNAAGEFALNNAVAELVFSEPLSADTFRRWMVNLFNNKRNRFRIGGYANWHGKSKVQATAIDQHLWQPLQMEFTTKRVVAVLPYGTCGNTINRLVSNVQRFVDPRVKAYVGDVEYSTLIPDFGAAHVG